MPDETTTVTRAATAAHLPQLDGTPFLMDSGLETTLVFQQGVELREFAAFELLLSDTGRGTLEAYYRRHARLAAERRTGFIFETPTWRANASWGAKLGYDAAALREVNQRAVAMMWRLADEYLPLGVAAVVAGNVGPRGDGYVVGDTMSAAEAEDFHGAQIAAFADAGADMATSMTLTYVAEAIGIANAAKARDLPSHIAFTVETDGRLPSGEGLGEAIEAVDHATGAAPAYYMINCAHPEHFEEVLKAGGAWRHRIRGLRANASRMSHAELDASEELDEGNPVELGEDYRRLKTYLPNLTVFGGCCGTDHRHVHAIADACVAA